MSLDLDKRQHAMLREMGIKLWLPDTDTASDGAEAAPTRRAPEPALALARPAAVSAPVSSPMPAPTSAPVIEAANETAELTGPSWQLGAAQSVYPAGYSAPETGGTALRWLLLAEASSASVQPLDGDAGQLLDNMLRAAGMHRDAQVLWVPAHRARAGGPAAAEGPGLQGSLAGLIQAHQPSLVLVMGRLLSQALAPSAEPFAKRRGQPLMLHGCPALLSYDTTYLLRALPEKARAWEDLCLARVMAAQAKAS